MISSLKPRSLVVSKLGSTPSSVAVQFDVNHGSFLGMNLSICRAYPVISLLTDDARIVLRQLQTSLVLFISLRRIAQTLASRELGLDC